MAIAFGAGGGMAGLSAVYGALIPGAIVVMILGASTAFHHIIGRLVPPLVGGTIIIVVGIALMPVALRDRICHAPRSSCMDVWHRADPARR